MQVIMVGNLLNQWLQLSYLVQQMTRERLDIGGTSMLTGGVSAHGRRLIAALDAGRAVRRAGDGWVAGPLVAPASLVADLKGRDLVREEGDRLVLTVAGTGWSARYARPDAPNRLLAERTLSPEPAPGGARTGMRARPVAARSVTVNLAEAPLGWLKARGLVSDRQFEAGERLRTDWETAQMAPSVTMRWDQAPSSSGRRAAPAGIDPTLAQISAKRRMEAAMAAAGPGMQDVLWRVACAGEGLEGAERALGWPKRAGKLVLLMALDRVADHYGIR
jgi:hypothetical protein